MMPEETGGTSPSPSRDGGEFRPRKDRGRAATGAAPYDVFSVPFAKYGSRRGWFLRGRCIAHAENCKIPTCALFTAVPGSDQPWQGVGRDSGRPEGAVPG